ncbi:MAG: multicopper oxidase family protein [Planktomarina sp.]
MDRRTFLNNGAAALSIPALTGYAFAAEPGRPLPIPDILDVSGTADAPLTAMAGQHEFLSGKLSNSVGFEQSYLGPVLRMKRGEIARPKVANRLDFDVTAHWHGLHVPGYYDGGPQLAIAPGENWSPEMEIDQPAATLWYHSHVHMQTGPQVYFGLAGMLLIDDPNAKNETLPSTWGVDDIPAIVQDKAFDRKGNLTYSSRGPSRMHGFTGNEMIVNGAIKPSASVAKGLVRLRILNASNARIYHFSFEDGRAFHQIASDGGFLPKPSTTKEITLAPAERVEILVDFSKGGETRLMSRPDSNSPMGGNMVGAGNTPTDLENADRFEIMQFVADRPSVAGANIPTTLKGAPGPITAAPVRRRVFELDMFGGGGMMGGMRGGGMHINGKAMDMSRIDEEVRLGDTEIWEIHADRMAHPFHIHGTSFQVLTANDEPVPFETMGLKDVALANSKLELLVPFHKTADRNTPYMYHCHILEHEDAGMMGQFTVT